jgi:hypothetical protein
MAILVVLLIVAAVRAAKQPREKMPRIYLIVTVAALALTGWVWCSALRLVWVMFLFRFGGWSMD